MLRSGHLLLALSVAFLAGACALHGTAAETPPPVTSLLVEVEPDTVHFVFQMTNAGDTPLVLEYATGQEYDFLVYRDGEELWRWSGDRMFTQALHTDTIAPGETRIHRATWTPATRHEGDLVARAVLTAAGSEIEQEAIFRLR